MVIQIFSMEIDMLSNKWSNIEETMIVIWSKLVSVILVFRFKSIKEILSQY
jgi:hypothetical protein